MSSTDIEISQSTKRSTAPAKEAVRHKQIPAEEVVSVLANL